MRNNILSPATRCDDTPAHRKQRQSTVAERSSLADLTENELAGLRRRFSAKVKPDPVTGCLNWIGAVAGGGYGQFGIRGRVFRAHRVAWELAHGPIPAGLVIRHRCNNSRCVNAAHLQTGTHLDNMEDMTRAGRQNRSGPKLTSRDAVTMRGLHDFLGYTWPEIAQEFCVGRTTVANVMREKTWLDAFDQELEKEAQEATAQ
jgi:hypothetical protein